MICRLCDYDKQLIDAHIIPRPFFTEVDSGHQRAKVMSNREAEHPKRLPIGFYDPAILCAECDNRIGRWDEYGIETLIQKRHEWRAVPSSDDPVAFVQESFDYARLKLFFLSVLWRAHESSLQFFSKVHLGPYRDRLFHLISTDDPGTEDEFSVLLSEFTVENKLPKTGAPLLDPHPERWEGIHAYRLSLGIVTAYVKVDRRPFAGSFAHLVLKPNQPLTLVAREFGGSAEAGVAQSIVNKPKNRRAFRPRNH
jgi:hypothetical protein